MDVLSADVHEYVMSYLCTIEDLCNIAFINKQFLAISTKYSNPLVIADKRWPEAKWISMMRFIRDTYRGINQLHIKRCNITDNALSILFTRSLKTLDLLECRNIGNTGNWLHNLDRLKCSYLSLGKCTKLPEFLSILHANSFTHITHLLLDRQSLQAEHAPFVQNLPNLCTLALTNSQLYHVPLSFLSQLTHLKHLFMGGSQLFHLKWKNVLLNVSNIMRTLAKVELMMRDFKPDLTNHNIHIDTAQTSQEEQIPLLVVTLHSVLSSIHVLVRNHLELLEISFQRPDSISLAEIRKYHAESHSDLHFDALSVLRCLFLDVLFKHYKSDLTIVDLSSFPEQHEQPQLSFAGLRGLCSKYDKRTQLTIGFVADIASNSAGQSALHIACKDGSSRYVSELLERGVCSEYRDRRGTTPLFEATVSDHEQCVKLLVAHGADVFKRKSTKETPVEVACMRQNVRIIELMLDSQPLASFNNTERYDNQWSPVHCCCISGKHEILKLLLARGLVCAEQNGWKQSPLHICAIKNHVRCARLLVQRYDVGQLLLCDEFEKTAEFVAHKHNNYDVARLIRRRLEELQERQPKKKRYGNAGGRGRGRRRKRGGRRQRW